MDSKSLESKSFGRVKWYREDGTGYIESGGVTFYVDASCVVPGSLALDAGIYVAFVPQLILDRWVATQVSTHRVLQQAERDAMSRDLFIR